MIVIGKYWKCMCCGTIAAADGVGWMVLNEVVCR